MTGPAAAEASKGGVAAVHCEGLLTGGHPPEGERYRPEAGW